MSAHPESNPTPVEGAVHTVDDAVDALQEPLMYLWEEEFEHGVEAAKELSYRVVRVLEYLEALSNGQASVNGEAK
jgi:hypothetical protein